MVNLTTFLFLLLVIVCSPQIKAFAGNEVALENAYLRWEELEKQGNYHEARPYAEQALRLEKEFDPYSKYVGESLNYIGVLYQRLGKYAEAEKSHSLALKILKSKLGSEHLAVATALYDFAWLYFSQGRYLESESLFKRARIIQEARLGSKHVDVAHTLSALASLYLEQGRYDENAEKLYLDALETQKSAFGQNHPEVLATMNGLAALYWSQARYNDAEPLFREVLEIQESTLGYHHPDLSITLNYLGLLYLNQRTYKKAEPLLKRSLAINENALGLNHPSVATALSDLAQLYSHQKRYTEAEQLIEKALKLQKSSIGPSHPYVALTLSTFAELFKKQHRYDEAEALFQRAISIYEVAFAHDHPHTANLLNSLAKLYSHQGKYDRAKPLLTRALKIQETMLGLMHPSLAYTLNSLATLHYNEGRYKTALKWARRSTNILKNRFTSSNINKREALKNEQREARKLFYVHISLANKQIEGSNHRQLEEESFEVAQLAHTSEAGAVISNVAARFSAGEDALAQTVREQQDTIVQWRILDKALIEEVGKLTSQRDNAKETRLRRELEGVNNKLSGLNNELTREFPNYAELSDPKPLSSSNIQELLASTEALISYLVSDTTLYIWVLRHDAMHMTKVKIEAEELEELVMDLRVTLEPFDSEILDFDTEQSHVLYEKIFAPLKPYINSVKHLVVVPDGPLESIPFSVLISKPPPDVDSFKDYKNVSWLGLEYSFTTLPSVSSLKALRISRKVSQQKTSSPIGRIGDPRMSKNINQEKAFDPFIGFGDPILEGIRSDERGSSLTALFNRGPVANVNEIKKLSPLPETADELRLIASSLGADETALYLRNRATEQNVKDTDLSNSKVLAFATHGLISGDLLSLREPGLIFTPPEIGTNIDDGILSASEVAQLKLFPGLVILSACNTASSDGAPDAGGLSGLAKAFFYAGSQTLLVSHWAVPSQAAKYLTTRMFEVLAKNPKMGPSEALKQSMTDLINDKNDINFSHPIFWAPFVVVGEGAMPFLN